MNEKITANPQKEEREKVLKEIRQLENRKKILENKQRNEERRVRTRRLIERGAILEGIFPLAPNLSSAEVKAFLIAFSHRKNDHAADQDHSDPGSDTDSFLFSGQFFPVFLPTIFLEFFPDAIWKMYGELEFSHVFVPLNILHNQQPYRTHRHLHWWWRHRLGQFYRRPDNRRK